MQICTTVYFYWVFSTKILNFLTDFNVEQFILVQMCHVNDSNLFTERKCSFKQRAKIIKPLNLEQITRWIRRVQILKKWAVKH